MVAASKVASVILRVGELICSAIVVGIFGRYVGLVDDAGVDPNDRVVYALSIGCISLLFSLILMPPLKYSFWAFPLDFALFICWMVAFGLLFNLTAGSGCDSYWVWHDWAYYWGGWFRTIPVNRFSRTLIGTVHCSYWRTGQAFSFIGSWVWLGNGLCGLYVCMKDRRNRHEEGISSTGSSSHPQMSLTKSDGA